MQLLKNKQKIENNMSLLRSVFCCVCLRVCVFFFFFKGG